MIFVKALSVYYNTTLALDDFSYDFSGGKLYGIIGRNGAGKSTLLKTLTGMIRNYCGSIKFGTYPPRKARRNIGYSPEDIHLLPYLSAKEYLQLVAGLRQVDSDTDQIESLLIHLGLNKIGDALTIDYSHGMRKKLSLAAALIGDPQYIILDEAFNGLDAFSLDYAKQKSISLAEKGHLVLLASHDIELISDICTNVIILDKGKLIREYDGSDIRNFSGTLRQHIIEGIGHSDD